jgi:hypothetical protein
MALLFCCEIKQLSNIACKIVLVFDSLFTILYTPVDYIASRTRSGINDKKSNGTLQCFTVQFNVNSEGGEGKIV